MSIAPAKSNEVLTLRLGEGLSSAKTTTLVKTGELELIRLVLPAGKVIPTHRAPGAMTVQCLEGRIGFTAGGKTQELGPGELLYLDAGEPHAVQGIENSSALVTLRRNETA